MLNLILASSFLLLSHFLIASTPLRGLLVSRLGERLYSKSYSLLAVLALAWLVIAYRQAPSLPLWQAPRWLGIALTPFMLLASVLIVGGLTTPNPVIVGLQKLFDRPDIVRGTLRITRNPFFWGMGLFALAHLILIGDVAATLVFGSVAILGLAGARILDAKKARRHGDAWKAFAAKTSDVPFLAIAQGRQRFAWDEIGWWRLALGVALFAAVLALHRMLLGGNPLGSL
jgi:uncharacterized membrane protein